MKKLATTLHFLLFAALTTQAQTQVQKLGASAPITGGLESFFLPAVRGGGGAGISFSTLESDGNKSKTTPLGFSPVVGYAVADNLLLGVGLNVFSSKKQSRRGQQRRSAEGDQLRFFR